MGKQKVLKNQLIYGEIKSIATGKNKDKTVPHYLEILISRCRCWPSNLTENGGLLIGNL